MIVQPCFAGACSVRGGYELGLGAFTCVYDEASVDEELFWWGFGTGFGAEDEEDLECVLGHPEPDASSSSEPLSQASSSPHSAAVEYEEKRVGGLIPI